jgi:hypothetical protein
MFETRLHQKGRGWRTAKGSLSIWTPAPTLLVLQIAGHGAGDFCRPCIAAFDQCIAKDAPIRMFVDLEQMHNYDTGLRTEVTRHLVDHKSGLGGLDVLVRSRIVAMGVSVANMALGGLVAMHASRVAFLRDLDAELRAVHVVGFSPRVLGKAKPVRIVD